MNTLGSFGFELCCEQTDRQTDRQTDKQTNKQTNNQTEPNMLPTPTDVDSYLESMYRHYAYNVLYLELS